MFTLRRPWSHGRSPLISTRVCCNVRVDGDLSRVHDSELIRGIGSLVDSSSLEHCCASHPGYRLHETGFIPRFRITYLSLSVNTLTTQVIFRFSLWPFSCGPSCCWVGARVHGGTHFIKKNGPCMFDGILDVHYYARSTWAFQLED